MNIKFTLLQRERDSSIRLFYYYSLHHVHGRLVSVQRGHKERGRDQIKCFGSRYYNILEAKGLVREDGKGDGVVMTHQVCEWQCHY